MDVPTPYSVSASIRTKEFKPEELDADEIKLYTPFVAARIGTMDGIFVEVINQTVNMYGLFQNDPIRHFQFLQTILPQKKYNRYIKSKEKKERGNSTKKEKRKDDIDSEEVRELAKLYCISEREVREYLKNIKKTT